MPKISVLMPCLNVAKYIRQCLESVVSQTFKDIEILVTDAGSTDGTLEIAEQFAENDVRIRIIHSKRKSYGYQLNLALSKAKGEYIGIVETDDYIEPYMFEFLLHVIEGTSAEYAKAGWVGFLRRKGLEWTYEGFSCPELAVAEKAVVLPWKRPDLVTTDCYLWNGIYRKNFLCQYRFQETAGAAFQDVSFLFRLIHGARQGIYLRRPVYHYRNDNAAASFYNLNGLNYIRSEYQALKSILPELSQEWQQTYYRHLVGHILGRFDAIAVSRKSFSKESEDSIRWLQGTIRDGILQDMLHSKDFTTEQWQKLQYFMQSADVLSRNIENTLQPFWFFLSQASKQGIIIFGCGAMGQFIAKTLRMGNIAVRGFCDNDLRKQGDILNDVVVLSPEDAVNLYPEGCFLITSQNSKGEMEAQLKSYGVPKKNILDGGKTYISKKHMLWAILQFADQYDSQNFDETGDKNA